LLSRSKSIETKTLKMDSGECIKQEDAGDSLPSDRDFPKPFWVRHFGLQTDSINQRLLEHNVRFVWICGLAFWLVFSVL
jgi:hypothetical protein